MIAINGIGSGVDSTESESCIAARYDAGLVKRFIDGDEKAFNEIFLRYRGRSFGIALDFLRSYCDAEEVTQSVFINAYKNLKTFRGDCSLIMALSYYHESLW